MEKRLTDIAPLVNQIEELNSVLDRPNEEVRQLVCLLRDGEALVKKCAEKVHWWNFLLTRPSYARKLLKLEEDLNRHLREIVQLQQRRDEMEILVKVNQIQATITGMGGYGNCIEGWQFMLKGCVWFYFSYLSRSICLGFYSETWVFRIVLLVSLRFLVLFEPGTRTLSQLVIHANSLLRSFKFHVKHILESELNAHNS